MDAVSGYPDAPALAGPTVCSLRDRLLREARNERQRCLEVAEAAERRRAECRGVVHAGVQTDPVAFAAPTSRLLDASPTISEPTISRRTSLCSDSPSRLPSMQPTLGALEDEDEEQMEAIRTLSRLNDMGTKTVFAEARISELDRTVKLEVKQREETAAQLADASNTKEAISDQVICLEQELDHREAALQAAEEALERRDRELEQSQLQLRILQESFAHSPVGSMNESMTAESRCRQLKSMLSERERQLEQKDRNVAHLLAILRTRGVYLEEDATTCGSSERSMAMTGSTASMGQCSLRGMY